MKCHYVYDEIAGKVLIPGCWAVVHHGNMKFCECRSEKEPTYKDYENQQYNKDIRQKDKEIKELEKEVAQLNRTIKKLLKIK